jgi:hypothetical protein
VKAEPNQGHSVLPTPARVPGGLAVPVDMASLEASLRFDVTSRVAEVSATVDLAVAGHEGFPAFDLRQPIDAARLDGKALPPVALAHHDLGAGDDAGMRVVEVTCPAASQHRLQVDYRLGTPGATGSRPVEWSSSGDGVAWDLWMSDLEPGRYLEMWFPANLCHDTLAIKISVEVAGTKRPHVLLANGALVEHVPGLSWSVRYPPTFTSLSPLLVLAPADEVELCHQTVTAGAPTRITVAGLNGAEADLGAVMADASAWLGYFSARYGAWAHGDNFLAVMWGAPRGMEYDGATTACEPALEHEIFHSWFGRGVKPARASDGWIDEAMATWATASQRATAGRFRVEELGLDQPASLLSPLHPWSRHTPREAYAAGSRLLAGVAHMAGGAAALRAALAAWNQANSGRQVTTDALARHLSAWCDRDLTPWWDRYVYGRD